MAGIYSDTGFKFEARGYVLGTATVFSVAHGKYITHVYAFQAGTNKIRFKSTAIYHEELLPELFDVEQEVNKLYLTILKP
jgi:hypothetical protein